VRPIRSFSSAALADAAARFLRAHGVHVRTSGRIGGSGILGAVGHGEYELMLLDESQFDVVERLLSGWNAGEERIDDVDLEAQARPDLSRLSPRHRPRCPGCGVLLHGSYAVLSCAGCGHHVEIERLIVDQHGPEALVACYPEEPEQLPAELIRSAKLDCPVCQYPLDALANDGTCPECGTGYSKTELLQRRAGF
jgi:hypothetical protein